MTTNLSRNIPSAGAAPNGVADFPGGLSTSPRFDGEFLPVRRVIVKHFQKPSASPIAILLAFEEEKWKRQIDNPLPPNGRGYAKQRLHTTINNLNRFQRVSLIHFFACRMGEGIGWEWVTK